MRVDCYFKPSPHAVLVDIGSQYRRRELDAPTEVIPHRDVFYLAGIKRLHLFSGQVQRHTIKAHGRCRAPGLRRLPPGGLRRWRR